MLSRFQGDDDGIGNSPISDTEENGWEDTTAKPVTKGQWQCCTDLCHSPPLKVTKEIETSYIICECANKKIYRVTRLKKVIKNGVRSYQ